MTSFDIDIAKLEDAMRLFAQTMKRPQRWTQIMAQSGLAVDRPSAVILHMLVVNHPKRLRVQDLAMQLGIEPPSVTRKTQELEQAGYLKRLPDPGDRRAVSLEITKSGRAVANKLTKAQHQIMRDALANWPAADRNKFISLFERFSQDLATASDNTKLTKKG